eukprot:2494876-Rhodomonas_salina.1
MGPYLARHASTVMPLRVSPQVNQYNKQSIGIGTPLLMLGMALPEAAATATPIMLYDFLPGTKIVLHPMSGTGLGTCLRARNAMSDTDVAS